MGGGIISYQLLSSYRSDAETSMAPFFVQINVVRRTIKIIQDENTKPGTAPLQYITSLVGGNDGFKERVCRQCIYPLVWQDHLDDSQLENTRMKGPNLMLDVRELKNTLVGYYTETVASSWPEVDGTKVVDVFLSDLLDVNLNGENVFVVPLTHLEQRLRLFTSKELNNIQHSDNGDCSDSDLVLNDRLRETFLYLSGQCYIQQNLQGSNACDMLSTLTRFDRSIQESSDYSYLNCCSEDWDTQTWLEVAHLASSLDKRVADGATKLLIICDRKIRELSESIQVKLESIHSRGILIDSNNYFPTLFANGPPILCYLSLAIAFCHGGKMMNFVPPLWMSMLLGFESSLQHVSQRLTALRGLVLLYEQQYSQLQIKSKQLSLLDTQSSTIMNAATSVNAVSRLMTRLGTSEREPQIRQFAKHFIQKLGRHLQFKPRNLKTISVRRPVRMIWNPVHHDQHQ
ncbi:hypothetical protein FGIG_08238 [Fasciola gigantica]|uniref:Uncharacterized protein n=1 Tax=Fasciola gigantica TaxID=46835 RepID=A0A504Y9V3_FASGI|nr:hypothetical protein FGIG_08238 [Fasciola gigantica]